MKERITIVKIGGNVIDDAANLEVFLESFSKMQGLKILVHGGGKLATELAAAMNIPQQIIDGRRVTDEATLKVITMVYAGYINKNIVARLQALKCNALGLSGPDGKLIQSHKRTHASIGYGFVGDVDAVNTDLLLQLSGSNYIPVIAPVTADDQGQLLNTNADTIAQEVAQALSTAYETRLIYCFEKAGVLQDINDESSLIASINKENFQALAAKGIIHTGMLPKLQNAFAALDKGVGKVILGKWNALENLAEGRAGTTIYR